MTRLTGIKTFDFQTGQDDSIVVRNDNCEVLTSGDPKTIGKWAEGMAKKMLHEKALKTIKYDVNDELENLYVKT